MPHKLRPSDVYTQPRERILSFIQNCGWKVVDFRQPKSNEIYYTTYGYLSKNYIDSEPPDGPRLICVPIPAAAAGWA